MAVDQMQTENAPSMSSLVTGIINDAQQLMRQELALARREVQAELTKARTAAVAFGIGAAVGALAAVLLSFFLVYLLTWATGLPEWVWFLIVGVLFAAAAGWLFLAAKSKVEQISLVPRQTVETMKENVQWLKTQT
jgi:protein-S-isoprenylcysteine O-methyltransferase Ste14